MVHGSARQREIERAVRAHPAGSALRARAEAGNGEAAGRRGPDEAWPTASPAPLRLTARGRRLLAVLTVAAGVGLASVVGSLVGGHDAGALRLVGQSSVVVRPGDTLWSLASSVAGDDDVRAVVDRIRQVNGLRSSDLTPGQVLVLP
jgi:nucleoid-associated protein YgaU